MIVEVLPSSGCFITCMGTHFPAVELNNAIRFNTLSRLIIITTIIIIIIIIIKYLLNVGHIYIHSLYKNSLS